MPTLDFKGKSFVYAHHLSVPFRELLIDAKKSLPAKGQKPNLDDNLIIHGDNLHALKAPLPVYAGKVDCMYIDPPYNPSSLVLTSEDGMLAHLAAPDVAALWPGAEVRVLEGGNAMWKGVWESGVERATTTRDDVWYKPYEHASDYKKHARDYLIRT